MDDPWLRVRRSLMSSASSNHRSQTPRRIVHKQGDHPSQIFSKINFRSRFNLCIQSLFFEETPTSRVLSLLSRIVKTRPRPFHGILRATMRMPSVACTFTPLEIIPTGVRVLDRIVSTMQDCVASHEIVIEVSNCSALTLNSQSI